MLPTLRAFRVWRRDLESWKRFALSFVVAMIGEPVFYLVTLGYGLGRFVTEMNGQPYMAFLAPGVIATAAVNTATFETTFGAYARMKEQHTYAAILATPCSVADVVAGDILWAATKSTLAACFVLILSALLGLITSPLALAIPLVAALVGLMFGALGMIATSRAWSWDFFSYYFTFFLTPMLLFSGVFFPADSLPPWAQTFAWFLPLSHAVAVFRALAAGHVTMATVADLGWMAAVTSLAFLVAERLVRRRLVV